MYFGDMFSFICTDSSLENDLRQKLLYISFQSTKKNIPVDKSSHSMMELVLPIYAEIIYMIENCWWIGIGLNFSQMWSC